MNKLEITLLFLVVAVAVTLNAVAGPAVSGLFCTVTFFLWGVLRVRPAETDVFREAVDDLVDTTNALRARELMDHNH